MPKVGVFKLSLPNFRAIGQLWTHISWLRDFARSGIDTTCVVYYTNSNLIEVLLHHGYVFDIFYLLKQYSMVSVIATQVRLRLAGAALGY